MTMQPAKFLHDEARRIAANIAKLARVTALTGAGTTFDRLSLFR